MGCPAARWRCSIAGKYLAPGRAAFSGLRRLTRRGYLSPDGGPVRMALTDDLSTN
jgi:hypothetical protein